MTKASFNRAIGDAIEPAGFCLVEDKRRDRTWRRQSGDYRQSIQIRTSSFDLKTASIYVGVADVALWREIKAASPSWPWPVLDNVEKNLGHLMGPYVDDWERSDPRAQTAAVEAIAGHAIPFIERVSSREGMRDYLEEFLGNSRGVRWGTGAKIRWDLAVIHLWLGNPQRGCDLLDDPPRRFREGEHSGPVIETIRRMCCEAAAKPS